MKKILIVSDTHRKDENLKQVIEKEKPLDMLIHLGDAEGSEYAIASWVNETCQMQMIGHYYNVSVGTEYLRQEARARGYDIVMFGHTHRPYYDVDRRRGDKDLIVLNPGSLSYPRQEGHAPSYAVMTLDDAGEAHFNFHFLSLE